MQLSAREIEAVKGIDRRRTALKSAGWSSLIVGAVLFANDAGLDWFIRAHVSLSVVFLLIGFFLITAIYFRSSPSDHLLDLLRRYVDNDAEALQQITKAKDGRGAT